MDKQKLENEINRLLDKQADLDPLSEEYRQIQQRLETMVGILLDGEKADAERDDRIESQQMRKQELEEKKADSKRRARSTVLGGILAFCGTVFAGGVALIGTRNLKETKQEQGMVDRDELSMVRTTYPKM